MKTEENFLNRAWKVFYKNYKKTMIIPIAVLIACTIILANNYVTKGEIIGLDLSLKGGVYFTINTDKDFSVNDLTSWISDELGTSEVDVRKLTNAISQSPEGYSFMIGLTDVKRNVIEGMVGEKFGVELNNDNFSFGVQGSELGESFLSDFLKIIIVSFILMGVVIFYFFRKPATSISIVFSTFADVVFVITAMSLIGAKLSIGSLGAILMIIGYSSNSDVLLATHILKRKDGEGEVRVKRALKTELTNDATAILAFLVMFLLSAVPIIKQIALVLCIGVAADLLNTWFMGRGLLMSLAEKEGAL